MCDPLCTACCRGQHSSPLDTCPPPCSEARRTGIDTAAAGIHNLLCFLQNDSLSTKEEVPSTSISCLNAVNHCCTGCSSTREHLNTLPSSRPITPTPIYSHPKGIVPEPEVLNYVSRNNSRPSTPNTIHTHPKGIVHEAEVHCCPGCSSPKCHSRPTTPNTFYAHPKGIVQQPEVNYNVAYTPPSGHVSISIPPPPAMSSYYTHPSGHSSKPNTPTSLYCPHTQGIMKEPESPKPEDFQMTADSIERQFKLQDERLNSISQKLAEIKRINANKTAELSSIFCMMGGVAGLPKKS